MLVTSVRFTEHISPEHISPEYRAGIPVRVNMSISSFLCLRYAFHTIMYAYSWFIIFTQSLLAVRLAVSEIKPVQTDKQKDGQRD